jgi:hypothetical protein
MAKPEQAFQIKLVSDLAKILPPDCVMTAFPAGGGGLARGKALKAMGLLAGMPDLLFIHGGCAFGMELKLKSTKPSAVQIAMHEKLAISGVDVRVVRTIDDALGCLKEWEIPTRIINV